MCSVWMPTGPNASGKSCYAKQVALVAFMAHLGSFVPAQPGTVVGLVDRIFTRLVSSETLAMQQSTFLVDLTQVGAQVCTACQHAPGMKHTLRLCRYLQIPTYCPIMRRTGERCWYSSRLHPLLMPTCPCPC